MNTEDLQLPVACVYFVSTFTEVYINVNAINSQRRQQHRSLQGEAQFA